MRVKVFSASPKDIDIFLADLRKSESIVGTVWNVPPFASITGDGLRESGERFRCLGESISLDINEVSLR